MIKKRLLISILCILLSVSAAAAIAVFTVIPIPAPADEKIALYTRNKPNAELTVALITPDETIVRAYGHDGKPIAVPEREYAIGEITRTFTAALASKALLEERISRDAHIADYLPMNQGNYNPTVEEILTGTTAFADYFPEGKSHSRAENPFSMTDSYDILVDINNFRLLYQPPYLYNDSDFGAAIAGMLVAKAYDVDFYSILTIFATRELGLEDTYVRLSTDSGWCWDTNDAYIASRGLTSTINDMVAYAKLCLSDENEYISHTLIPKHEVNVDVSVGYMWDLTDNGKTAGQGGEAGGCAAQIMLDLSGKNAVVVLSNYGNDRYGSVGDIAMAILNEARQAEES